MGRRIMPVGHAPVRRRWSHTDNMMIERSDSVKVAYMLEKAGIDGIELSGGLLNNPNIMQIRIDSDGERAYF